MMYNKVMKNIYSKIESRKKVSRLSVSEKELIKYGRTIDFINVQRDSNIIGGYNLDQFKIWKPFEDAILPIKVTLNGEYRGKDLSLRSNDVYDDIYNAPDFSDISYRLNAAFKCDGSKVVAAHREVVTVTDDIMKRFSFNDSVRSDASGLPIPLKANILFESDGMFCESEENYWNSLIFVLLDSLER